MQSFQAKRELTRGILSCARAHNPWSWVFPPQPGPDLSQLHWFPVPLPSPICEHPSSQLEKHQTLPSSSERAGGKRAYIEVLKAFEVILAELRDVIVLQV